MALSPPLQRLRTIPSLDQIADDPNSLAGLPAETLRALLLRSAAAQSALAARFALENPTADGRPEATNSDRLLTAEEAEALSGISARWLRRNHKKLPFSRKLSHKTLRFSEAGLRRWLDSNRWAR